MELLRKSKKLLLGGLAGSCITIFGPVTPIGLTGEQYTLEELAYQASSLKSTNHPEYWSFQWVQSKGFVLQKSKMNDKQQSVLIRRAVYRTIKEAGK